MADFIGAIAASAMARHTVAFILGDDMRGELSDLDRVRT
jgi:hypothetical protein